MELVELMENKARAAKAAANQLASTPTLIKNKALRAMADILENRSSFILEENSKDLEDARGKRDMKSSYLDRLMLNEDRIHQMAEGLRQTAALPDPIGTGDYSTVRPNGLEIRRVRVPLGVIGIIYEARPNVTADAAALCLKAGNSVILRGGSDALRSNRAIFELLAEAAYSAGIPNGAMQFVEVPDRGAVDVMLHLNGLVNVVIPRGGAGLIKHVVENSSVPVIETGSGICHTYVDESADFDMAVSIAINAKTSRPSVCNAMETLLVHKNIAQEFLPKLSEAMKAKHVELRGDEGCREIIPEMLEATEEDWSTEYGELILSVKLVEDIGEAIEHINKYNTGHSETIVTKNLENAHRFQTEVDAAAVYVNASTRFTDGFEFGFGAEIGISTQKLHARGPMGLEQLTIGKYLVYGQGQIR